MPPSISPQRLMAAMSAAQQVKQLLIGYSDEDLLASLESETDALELLDRVAEQAIADKELAAKASERAKRLGERAERARDIVKRMLEALELKKIERPLFTASIGFHTKAIVTDPDALPDALIRHAPDMVAIGKALREGEVPGATLSNPEPRLTIRTI